MLERRRGYRLRLGVDERLPAPRRFGTPLHVHRFNPPSAPHDGRDDLRGGDVVTRAEVDDHLDLTDQHRDLFLGQAVTRAHLRPNIVLHRLLRQAGMRFVFCVIKFITAPTIQKRIVSHPAKLAAGGGQMLSNLNPAAPSHWINRSSCSCSPPVG